MFFKGSKSTDGRGGENQIWDAVNHVCLRDRSMWGCLLRVWSSSLVSQSVGINLVIPQRRGAFLVSEPGTRVHSLLHIVVICLSESLPWEPWSRKQQLCGGAGPRPWGWGCTTRLYPGGWSALRLRDLKTDRWMGKAIKSNLNFLIWTKFYRLFLAKWCVALGSMDSGAL